MKLAIRKHAGHFAAVLGLALVAALVGGYILHNQRFRFPWEGKPFQLQAAFSTAQAVTPGQGQTVRVSGVRVGDISKVGLKDGHAVVTLELDPTVQGLRPHRCARPAAPQDRAQGHVHRARPGHRSRAAGQARVDAAGLQHAARRQPRRDPRLAGLRHARLPHAAGRRRRARA